MLRRISAAALATALCACAPDSAPTSSESAPEPSVEFIEGHVVAASTDSGVTRAVASETEFTFVESLSIERWIPGPLPGVHHAVYSVSLRDVRPENVAFFNDQSAFNWIEPVAGDIAATELAPGDFCCFEGLVFCVGQVGDGPPAKARLEQTVSQRFGADGHQRVSLPGIEGRGAFLSPGLVWTAAVDDPGGKLFRFTAAMHGRRADGPAASGTLLVTLDGESLGELELTSAEDALPVNAVFELPDTESDTALLEVEFSEPLALAALLEPRIESASGSPGPSEDQQARDVVLFVADTFRADNLGFYSGLPAGVGEPIAPYLDSLLAESAAFRGARSPSTWTLPSHASLFTSLWPNQHTAIASTRRLPEGLPTLASVLSDAGFRTVAVTEGGFCSTSFGLGGGFDVFSETRADFDAVRERVDALLEGDDGRPLFLFVQTFRVHAPYRAAPETLERLGLDVEPREPYDAMQARVMESVDGRVTPAALLRRMDVLAPYLNRMHALYRGGVAEFDAEFEAFWRSLRARRTEREPLLVFTSDHGESFGEHGVFEHSAEPWEDLIRVPLFVYGVEQRVEEAPASLIDVAPTILGVLGLPRPTGWMGADLLADEFGAAPRELYATHEAELVGSNAVSRTDGSVKWIWIDGEESGQWFDLALDPGERTPLPEPVPGVFRSDATFDESNTPRLDSAEAFRDLETKHRLMALGYLVEDVDAQGVAED